MSVIAIRTIVATMEATALLRPVVITSKYADAL